MLLINNHNEHDAAVNLALEEYVLRNASTDEDLLLLYINAPSIIIGRHQNTWEEINHSFVERNGIQVVRRLSGGGTVYHDLGNLNYSYITPSRPEDFRNFKKFTGPAVQTLAMLGVPAVLSERNDLLIEGRKISGNAQYISRGRMVSHGTLLFNADIAHVSEALKVQVGQFTSKAIKSVRSPVTNISAFLQQPMPIEQFQTLLMAQLFPGEPQPPQYPLTADDWAAIHRLADERYRSWEWTYGHSPDFTVERRVAFSAGDSLFRMEIRQGIIRSVTVSGDAFTGPECERLEKLLIGVRYRGADIVQACKNEAGQGAFLGLDLQLLGASLA